MACHCCACWDVIWYKPPHKTDPYDPSFLIEILMWREKWKIKKREKKRLGEEGRESRRQEGRQEELRCCGQKNKKSKYGIWCILWVSVTRIWPQMFLVCEAISGLKIIYSARVSETCPNFQPHSAHGDKKPLLSCCCYWHGNLY